MREFFDTSVLIAAFWRGHPQHEASIKLVAAATKKRAACGRIPWPRCTLL